MTGLVQTSSEERRPQSSSPLIVSRDSFSSKNLQITSKLLTQGYRYHKHRKTFGKFFRSHSDLLSKFCEISFQEIVSKGISQPVFYGDLVYKLRKVNCEAYFVSSGSKIVKHLGRRQYDPVMPKKSLPVYLYINLLFQIIISLCNDSS